MKTTHKMKNNEYSMRNRVVPAILASLSITLIVVIFGFINFDARYGMGASAILFSSFASSAFILFLVPKSNAAKLPKFIKSYVIGGSVGLLGILTAIYTSLPLYVITAIFIFITIMLMVLTKSEHPPGVGIAFAFILYHIDFFGIFIVILGILMLIFVRVVLEKLVFVVEKDISYLEHKR